MLVHQQPLLPPTPAVVHPVPAPRKRRRRAPTTGATEDCFTCRANGAKCDRRRPYCGPCLDIGNECKGYRTQLTWGVGVASRGKLRGMTLPVSIASNISVAERDRRCAVKRKSVDETAMRVKKLRTGLETNNCLGDIDNRPFTEDIERQSIIVNYNFVNMEHPSATKSYSTSMVNTHLMMQSSYLPLLQHPQHRQEYPPTVLNYHKPSYSHDSMNVRPSGLMAASALSDCDQVYTPHSDSPYSLSPSPSDSSIYDGGLIVTNAYLPPSSLTVTSNVPYAPLITSAQPGPQPTDSHNVHQHWGHIGIHQQHVSAAAGNLSDIVYGEEVLGTF
ncbi:hypothetical protein EV426DRAFT_192172 [Tirmania nivea]|nr:hypothetical protein EV426DRAFT_192172 [Tirmania nivea]